MGFQLLWAKCVLRAINDLIW